MGEVRVYRFYNMSVSKYGEPFALCDKHFKTQKIPNNCILNKIANKSNLLCVKCEEQP